MKDANWSYVGDVRCPCHHIYSKVHCSGRGDKAVFRLTCGATGNKYYRNSLSCWKKYVGVKTVREARNVMEEAYA